MDICILCFSIDPTSLLKTHGATSTLEKKAGVLDEELSTIPPDRLDRPGEEEEESGKEPR